MVDVAARYFGAMPRWGGPTILEAFLASMKGRDDECWPYPGYRDHLGYGRVKGSGPPRLAHRAAYELLRGPMADGLVLDHLCRNPSCCNPGHLEPVTQRENILRGTGVVAQAARKTHCPKGHAYDAVNTLRTPSGDRKCRECNRMRARAFKKRRRLQRAME